MRLRNLRYLYSNFHSLRKGFPYKFNEHPVAHDTPEDFDSDDHDLKIEHTELVNYFFRTVSKLFGREVFDGFKIAYRDLLQSFQQNNTSHLKTILEPLLFDSLRVPELQLIEPDNPIKCRIVDMEIALGVLFDRRATPHYKSLAFSKTDCDNIDCFWYREGWGIPNTERLPILRVGVQFLTACQLLPIGQPINNHKTVHTVYFDMVGRSGKLNRSGSTVFTTKMFIGFSNLKLVVDRLQMEGYDWMISDIDGFLEGNKWHKDPQA